MSFKMKYVKRNKYHNVNMTTKSKFQKEKKIIN